MRSEGSILDDKIKGVDGGQTVGCRQRRIMSVATVTVFSGRYPSAVAAGFMSDLENICRRPQPRPPQTVFDSHWEGGWQLRAAFGGCRWPRAACKFFRKLVNVPGDLHHGGRFVFLKIPTPLLVAATVV